MAQKQSTNRERDFSKPDGVLLPVGTSVLVLRPSIYFDAVGAVEKHVDGMNHVKLNSKYPDEYYHAQLPGGELEPYI